MVWLLQVLRVGAHIPEIHIANSPSLERVDFRKVQLTPSHFPRLELLTCPRLATVTIQSLEYCMPMDDFAAEDEDEVGMHQGGIQNFHTTVWS